MSRRVAGPARVAVGLGVTAGLGATGVLLLSLAAAGAGPTNYAVVIGGSATPVAPVTATPAPGQSLIFVNSGNAPYVLTRTATPLALSTTLAPTSSSTPYPVPTAYGSYPYTAQLRLPNGLLVPGSAGPTISAQIAVVKPSSDVPVAPAPSAAATSAGSAPTAAGATTAPARPAATTAKPRRSSPGKASASASASASAIQPGGLLPQPAEPPLFSDGLPVPLPVLPTAEPTTPAAPAPPPSDAAAAQPPAPIASASPAPLAVGPIAGDAPRQGPRRSRGLPIALALALVLGVGGALARTLRRTR